MRLTVSVIKADIGAIGGHTLPSDEVLGEVRDRVMRERGRLLIDAFVYHTGDDIAVVMTHTRGVDHPDIHQLAWDAFRAATEVARRQGLYGAGQDLLKDAFSGNVRGLGPGSAEIECEERPNEAVVILTADKTEPGAFNLPLYLVFADPMYSSGLLLSEPLHPGFTFRIMDVDHTAGDRLITLDAPERLYDIAALLRDTHRYVIESIWSRAYPGEQAAAVSTSRLRNIAGRYVGKDDPCAVVRVQKIFPATEELGPAFALGPYVAGDTRGSHNLPLMPVPMNTPASTFFCCPMVCGLGFSIHEGRLTGPTDLFADPFWHAVRDRIAAKAMEMRRQGFFGPAMLPMSELEYGGIVARLRRLEQEFVVRSEPAGAPVRSE
ncbi:MAG: fructose-1,6-bisphosphate aldolase/phosphatase [Armatimonadota bacterium]|nr:fructose-1,6-bisphosphate aldolase/phosphatase [Armatimonadota bacterium]MDR7400775.1 fructose-1,6-bisphosphate aldolase/phosphatase [Armatimonadota bacterium]MDR7403888.1 fructose-1,6-bisphosphate aldolase/phosphatase [Armatimonadota bacterium]MDR7436631.1 fructose-1,6-bisphosphate aldolase/phosphatase [Armatimonadota bacterium]MDR7472950.1 fructose-1,6-bisphosphate aldolase/phosphatase [Armatimonadota bacterium]